MSRPNANATNIAKVFQDFCNSRHYQIEQSEELNNLRIDISNLSERTIVKVYYSGTIQIQGKQNALKYEMETLKVKFEADPQSFLGYEIPDETKACATRYDIMVPILRTKVKESLNMLGTVEFTESQKTDVEYRAKITRNEFSLTVTQFKNGTLLLQGKTSEQWGSGLVLQHFYSLALKEADGYAGLFQVTYLIRTRHESLGSGFPEQTVGRQGSSVFYRCKSSEAERERVEPLERKSVFVGNVRYRC